MRVLELTSRMAGSDQPEATLAALMGLLGVPTESDEGEPYGLVEAFALDAGRSALRAWNGEAEAKRIAGALKDLE